MRHLVLIFSVFVFSLITYAQDGVLVVAHGTMSGGHGDDHGGHLVGEHDCGAHPSAWEQHVLNAVQSVQAVSTLPVSVGFGMWETPCFQQAVDHMQHHAKLKRLFVIPLFISSHSMVISAQKYIFGASRLKPLFPAGIEKLKFDGEIKYLSAIDYHPIVSEILADRARSLIEKAGAGQNEIILVMHGPVGPIANRKWLRMGDKYAADLTAKLSVVKAHVVSLQDDAPTPIRNYNSKTLRKLVSSINSRGNHPIVLPLLLSEGGIQKGIEERLTGLNYFWSGEALLPDARLSEYLRARVEALSKID
jgi:sirohydrochlorin cobaltochelatase